MRTIDVGLNQDIRHLEVELAKDTPSNRNLYIKAEKIGIPLLDHLRRTSRDKRRGFPNGQRYESPKELPLGVTLIKKTRDSVARSSPYKIAIRKELAYIKEVATKHRMWSYLNRK